MNNKRYFLTIILSSYLIFGATAQAASSTIGIKTGWNLISLPVKPATTSIGTVLSGIDGSYEAVYAFTGTQYESYIPGEAGNTLTNIDAGRGYWVYAVKEAALNVEGATPSTGIQLRDGWNLVGFNSTSPLDADKALSSIAGKYDAVYAFNSTTNGYQSYIPGQAGDLSRFEPGRGYWIYASSSVTWTLPASDPTPVPPGTPRVIFDVDITKGEASLPSLAKVIGGKWEAAGWRTTGLQGERIVFDAGYEIKSGVLEVSFATNQLPWTSLPKALPSPAPAERTHKLNFVGMYELPDLLQCTDNTRPCPPNRQPDILYIRTGSKQYNFVRVKAYVEGADEKLWEQSTGGTGDWNTDDKTVYRVKLEWKNGTGIYHDPKGKQFNCPQNCLKKLDALRYAVLGSDNYAAGSPKGIRFISAKLTDYNEAR
jgi:hypothetical protein